MCGRFVVSYTYDQLLNFISNTFNIFDLDENIDVPRYNIAPGQDVITVIKNKDQYRLGELKWGFVPHYAKDEKIGYTMINARSETIAEKNAFKDSYKRRRCLILANGFYEWDKIKGTKTPYYIYPQNKKMIAFAGIWSSYQKEDGTNLYTCAIVTTNANSVVGEIHERMPVILDEEKAKTWVDNNIDNQEVLNTLFAPYEDDLLSKHPVSKNVNKVVCDNKTNIEEYIETTLL